MDEIATELGVSAESFLPDPLIPADLGDEQEWLNQLAKLREPFPPERIEKLPKPLGKNAWDNQPSSHCNVCGGYHPQVRMIHLDYVGHASTTDRLLEVDPLWSWEPMAYTENGTPLFSDGGLWIKLTICGVTRLGYGDGKSVKEVIGDAIRNAAMRFGVALDLWAKIDLHAERNPDGPTQKTGSQPRTGMDSRQGTADRRSDAAVTTTPAPNQDALASLASVCDEHGYDQGTMREMFWKYAEANSFLNLELTEAPTKDIISFAQHLIITATPEPEVDDAGDSGAAVEKIGDTDDTTGDSTDNDPPF